MKVLLVDDSGLSRKVQKKVLREVGLEDVVEAKNGLDALQKLKDLGGAVELVLTDWNMPGMDGLKLIESLRADPATANLPVIVISSEGEEEKIAKAFAVGASSYVTKPFKKEVLARKIEAVHRIAQIEGGRPPAGDRPLIEGDLGQLGFAELVGFLNFSRKTGELIVSLETGEAGLAFEEGEVRDAWIGRFASEEAFVSIARLRHGHFRFHEGRKPRTNRITAGTMSLLMEAMKVLDEEAQGDGAS
ncbi:MAG: response regulator [Planctomycetota bacterium]|nr:MAG: response regulator [Planctomycetota bacterium]